MTEPDEHRDDLFWHALNYRGASITGAEGMWQELEACVARKVAAAVAAEREQHRQTLALQQRSYEREIVLEVAEERERICAMLDRQSAEYLNNAMNNRFLTDHGRAIMESASGWAETMAAAIRAPEA